MTTGEQVLATVRSCRVLPQRLHHLLSKKNLSAFDLW